MAMTRSTFLTRTRQMSDTLYGTVDYPDELLKDLGNMVHIDEWRKLLDVAPYYRVARVSVALDGNGRFPWASLSTGIGNNQQVVYRVLEMVDNGGENVQYAQPDRLRLAPTATLATTNRLWTRVGPEIQTFGVPPLSSVDVLVNYTPTGLGDLAADSDPVDWPDEWKPVLFYETAALALSKGGRETTEARELMQLADMMRQKMLAVVRRESAQPFILGADDSPWEWGG